MNLESDTRLRPATIKLFLPYGDARRLRTAEISNWSGKALAAPRLEFDELLKRDELAQSGIYILAGADPDSGEAMAYIGEGEVLRDRMKVHKGKDFWVQAFVFVSKDENLTKAHIRQLEGRLIEEAQHAKRFRLANSLPSGARLPEADRYDMEVFLSNIYQLLPVLGSDLLTPVVEPPRSGKSIPLLRTAIERRGIEARGRRTPTGFVVLAGSLAVADDRPAALKHSPYVVTLRNMLRTNGVLVPRDGRLVFTQDQEFASPSTAAAVVHGGAMNGLTAWKDSNGRTLRELEGE